LAKLRYYYNCQVDCLDYIFKLKTFGVYAQKIYVFPVDKKSDRYTSLYEKENI